MRVRHHAALERVSLDTQNAIAGMSVGSMTIAHIEGCVRYPGESGKPPRSFGFLLLSLFGITLVEIPSKPDTHCRSDDLRLNV